MTRCTPLTPVELTQRLVAIHDLVDVIAPPNLPLGLHYYRQGEVALLDTLAAMASDLREELGPKAR